MSTSLTSRSKDINGNFSSKTPGHHKNRRRKLARARRPRGEFDSDEDRELDASSDTDSQFSDDDSATNSESERSEVSDLEEGSSVRSGRERVSSPPTPVVAVLNQLEGQDLHQEKRVLSGTPIGISWSDAVQESLTGNAAGLPVIDFADFRPELQQAVGETHELSIEADSTSQTFQSVRSSLKQKQHSTMSPPPRLSARQVYQERLTNDPSFVPVVGEFWGHDDRLMDKEFRSLSGWWRGRWQGRGRGGFGRSWDHGRGNHSSGRPGPNDEQTEENLPSVDKTWSHDGFEELNKPEERRPFDQARRGWRQNKFQPRLQPRRSTSSNSAGESRLRTPLNPTARAQAQAAAQGRPWFAKKPERIWTKQFDGFLHVDPELKSNNGKSQSVRVRLQSCQPVVVPLSETSLSKPGSPQIQKSDELLGHLVVRLPGKNWSDFGKTRTSPGESHLEPAITYEEPPLVSGPDDFSFPDQRQQSNIPQVFSMSQPTDLPQPQPPEASFTVDQTPPIESSYCPSSFQPPINGASNSTPFASPIYYNPVFNYGSSTQPGVFYGEMGYTISSAHRGPFYVQAPPHTPYGRVPSRSQILTPPDMVHYQPMMTEYIAYPESQPLQFSFPKRSAKVEIRAPKDVERALLNPSSSSISSSGEQDNRESIPTYYPTIDTSVNPSLPTNLEAGATHPISYGDVPYYNLYGYSYINPYEGYDDGRRVYY